MFFVMWISWTSLWKTLEIMFTPQILGFRRKLNFWKNNVVKENLEMFSLLLGPKAINKCQSCWKGPGRMKNKIEPYFPCLKYKCMTRWGSISLLLRWGHSSEGRKNSVHCSPIAYSRRGFLISPFLCKKCVTGKQWIFRCSFQLLTQKSKPCFVSQAPRAKNHCVSVENEIWFGSELNFHAAPNRHRFHFKEVNFILYFQFQK